MYSISLNTQWGPGWQNATLLTSVFCDIDDLRYIHERCIMVPKQHCRGSAGEKRVNEVRSFHQVRWQLWNVCEDVFFFDHHTWTTTSTQYLVDWPVNKETKISLISMGKFLVHIHGMAWEDSSVERGVNQSKNFAHVCRLISIVTKIFSIAEL